MNDHNLDDLIIDSMEPNQSKTKSFLTIIALFIVFLIVGIILARSTLKESTDDTLALEENNSEMIAPELKLQAPVKIAKEKDETSLSSIIEEEIGAPEDEVKLKAPIEKPVSPTIVQKPVEIPEETVSITEEYTQIPQTKEAVKPIVEETETDSIEVPIIETPKPVKKVVAPKPIKKAVVPKEIPTAVTNTTYYIQVGSFTQDPSSRFLSVIKNSGFNYSITDPTSKGTKKLLIGPYSSRDAVDHALKEVKDRINKSAFVVKK